MTAAKSRWWVLPALGYGLTRLILLVFLALRAPVYPTPESRTAGFWSIFTMFDSDFYERIATEGYTSILPYYPSGHVFNSEWAFYPLWPKIVGGFMHLTSLSYGSAALFLSLLLPGVAILMLHRFLLRHTTPPWAWLVTLWLIFGPVTGMFIIGYTESLAILLAVGFVWALEEKKWGWLALVLLGLGLVRAIALGAAFALALVWLVQVRRAWEKKEAKAYFKTGGGWQLTLSGLWAGLCFGIWPLIAWRELGRWDAYLYVQSAWQDFMTDSPLLWIIKDGMRSPLLAAGILAFIVVLNYSVKTAKLPLALKAWALGYTLYILLFNPAGFYHVGVDLASLSAEPQADVAMHPALPRYFFLGLIPFLPFHKVPWAKLKHRYLWISLALLASFGLALGWLELFLLPEDNPIGLILFP